MNKASGGDGIPLELFQILKDDSVKVLHSICQQVWKTQQWPQDWKRSVFIPILKKGSAKEYSNYHTITLISNAIMVMFKILQARLQQTVCEPRTSRCTGWIQKNRGTRERSNCQPSLDHRKSKRVAEKASISALLTMPKPLTVWITTDWKILQEMGIPDHLTCLLRNLYVGQEIIVRTGHETIDWFKIGERVPQGYTVTLLI